MIINSGTTITEEVDSVARILKTTLSSTINRPTNRPTTTIIINVRTSITTINLTHTTTTTNNIVVSLHSLHSHHNRHSHHRALSPPSKKHALRSSNVNDSKSGNVKIVNVKSANNVNNNVMSNVNNVMSNVNNVNNSVVNNVTNAITEEGDAATIIIVIKR